MRLHSISTQIRSWGKGHFNRGPARQTPQQPAPGRRSSRIKGQALVTATLAMPVLMGMVGLAVDMGRLYSAKARLQAAVDASALAGSMQLMLDPEVNNGMVANSVNEYLIRNYADASVIEVKAGDEIRSVCVRGKVNVGMTFMKVLGIGSRDVDASACAGFDNIEVALVIDNTGSMAGEPMEAVKTAASELVDVLMVNEGIPTIKVGLVPFRGKVRIPDGVDGSPGGCRNANGTVNNSNVSAPDHSCTDGAMPYVSGLSYSKSFIKSAISRMNPGDEFEFGSNTVIEEGIKWGRHVLTPEEPFTQGGPISQFHKVMILLTDGDNCDGSPFCGGCDPVSEPDCIARRNAYFQMGTTTCRSNDHGCLDQAMLSEGQLAKDRKIEIFTIRYGTSDAIDIELMKAVASSRPGTDDHYFDAPASSDLNLVFKRIARHLGHRLL